MTTSRAIYDDVRNVVDFLEQSELALISGNISLTPERVSWNAYDSRANFLAARTHPDINQYVDWLSAGMFSAVLLDGSLMQVTYDIEGGRVTRHRLAYVPCPYDIDPSWFQEEALADVVEAHRGSEPVLRSMIRFDYDPGAAKIGHPVAHVTFNSEHCRVPCIAPMHVMRFTDFIFRHFYPEYRQIHRAFFEEAALRHLHRGAVTDDEALLPHLAWDVYAAAT